MFASWDLGEKMQILGHQNFRNLKYHLEQGPFLNLEEFTSFRTVQMALNPLSAASYRVT